MANKRINEYLRERKQVVDEMRKMLDVAEADGKRDLSDEETAKYDEMFETSSTIKEKVEREQLQVDLERDIATKASNVLDDEPDKEREDAGAGEQVSARATKEYRKAFEAYLRGGHAALTAEDHRALQADSDTVGGYLVAPEQFVAQLLKKVDDAVFVRRLGTVWQVPQAASLGVPTLDTDPADADWTAEIATGSEDSAMAFGKRELWPHPLAKRIKISKKLLVTSVLPIESIVMARLAYKFGITEEKGFLTGHGSGQPLGLFTASADGISTARDVSTGNTTTDILMDGLIEAKYSVKGQYWAAAQWLFHRDAVKRISKLKDGEGQYIWRVSVRDGEPDSLLGRPVNMSEFVPNTFTSGLYVGMYADFSQYWIADALDMQIQRLVELYAETNQDGFIGRLETDGMPVLEEAFARVKLA